MRSPGFLKSFIKNPRNTSYEGKDPDEVVNLIIRQSLITVYGWIMLAIIFLVLPFFVTPLLKNLQYGGELIFSGMFIFCITFFWYIFTFGFIFQNFLNWYFEVLLITNKKAVDIDKGCTNISETPLRNIQDVTSKIDGTWGQVFNIGSIHIQTAAEREEFEFHFVDNPSAIRDAISDLVLRRNHYKDVR